MGQFRDRMDEDMRLRGLSERTRKTYLWAMRDFVRFCRKPPDQVGPDEVRAYQLHLIRERVATPSHVNIVVCALRFFYGVTLGRSFVIKRMPFQKRLKKKPLVLSRQEMASFFAHTDSLKMKAVFTTIYDCGLRLGEARLLRVSDIDGKREVIRVQRGKGGRDRYVKLSPKLRELLREYYRQCRPTNWLFENKENLEPISESSVQRAFHRARVAAGITKTVTVHSLRHTFATHLLEEGVDIRRIQMLLGHTSVRTTQIYTHVEGDFLRQTPSLLDSLPTPGAPHATTTPPSK